MSYHLLGIVSIIILFSLMMACIVLGQFVASKKRPTAGLSVTEGAVFTLMGLLVAFTFSSANQRFDQRRAMITEETNAISTAYLRLDILSPKDRKVLANDFLSYITNRLDIYQALPNFKKAEAHLNASQSIQMKLWQDAVNASNTAGMTVPMMLLPSINAMFDIANTRTQYTYYHPHYLVFLLMILVAFSCSFLIGYGIADKGVWNSLHIITFILITTVTLYIIIDLEYPRLGVIQETQFDNQLIELQNDIRNGQK